MQIKKVLHVITTIERGGAEKQLLILAREQVKAGFQVEIAFLKGNPELEGELTQSGAQVFFDLSNCSLIRSIIFLRRKIKTLPNHIIHSHLPKAEVVTRFALILLENTFVVTRHNAEQFYPNQYRFLSSLMSRCILRRAASIVAISDAVRSFLRLNHEVPNRMRIDIVPYSFDSLVKMSVQVKRIPECQSPMKLVTIGRLTEQKNYPFLFQALQLLQKRGKKFSLAILGAGNLETELRALSLRLNISEHVSWLGKQADVPGILDKHDALIMASKYEGFGLVFLEAMQAALPIVAPRISAMPEVLGNNYLGLFSANDLDDMTFKITQLYDPIFYRNLSTQSILRIQEFQPSKMLEKMTQIYFSND